MSTIEIKFLPTEHVQPKRELLFANTFKYGPLPEGKDYSRGEVVKHDYSKNMQQMTYQVKFGNCYYWFLESELLKVA